jgi:hypothetical protein
MAETIEEITINYEEEGKLLTKELSKEVLTKGSWTTIMFKYSDLDRKTGEFSEPKATIRRYKKYNGRYQLQSKFNISSRKQARQIMEILDGWFPPEET